MVAWPNSLGARLSATYPLRNAGECDYCLQRCNCPEGFGSLSELEDVPEIARTCSELTCPFGISWTPVLSG